MLMTGLSPNSEPKIPSRYARFAVKPSGVEPIPILSRYILYITLMVCNLSSGLLDWNLWVSILATNLSPTKNLANCLKLSNDWVILTNSSWW